MSQWLPTNLGAEPKKIAVLGGLVVVLVAVYWFNSSPSVPESATPAPRAAAPAPIRTPAAAARLANETPMPQRRGAASAGERVIQDFRPSLKLPEGTDVSKIDPALHLEILAQARATSNAAGGRNLFEFGAPPPPPPPKVKPIVPRNPEPEAPKPLAANISSEPPKPPPPPPIALKFYGYAGTTGAGQRRAFFLDGEDIFVAGENDIVKSRYKIVRIGVNSAVVEDTTNKNQQTLPLVEENAA